MSETRIEKGREFPGKGPGWTLPEFVTKKEENQPGDKKILTRVRTTWLGGGGGGGGEKEEPKGATGTSSHGGRRNSEQDRWLSGERRNAGGSRNLTEGKDKSM